MLNWRRCLASANGAGHTRKPRLIDANTNKRWPTNTWLVVVLHSSAWQLFPTMLVSPTILQTNYVSFLSWNGRSALKTTCYWWWLKRFERINRGQIKLERKEPLENMSEADDIGINRTIFAHCKSSFLLNEKWASGLYSLALRCFSPD